MSNAEGSGSGRDDAFGAGMAWMFAFFTAALDSNRSLLSSLSEFPQASAKTGEKIGQDVSETNILNMPMEAIASGWKIFGDVMQAAFAGVSQGQDDAAVQMSQNIATALRNFTGMDQNDMLGGLARDWSPKHVAFRSFGLGDSDALAMSAEMVQPRHHLGRVRARHVEPVWPHERILDEGGACLFEDLFGGPGHSLGSGSAATRLGSDRRADSPGNAALGGVP